MKVRNWVSGLCCAILLSNSGAVGAGENQNLSEKRAVYNQDTSSLVAAKEYAVALAQAGELSQALEIFKQLYEKYPNNRDMVMDYVVVLNWAGNNRAAIALFEGLNGENLPLYVKSSAAGAYYQLGDFQSAQRLFHEVAVTGDRKAKIWEAQTLVRMGQAEIGYETYKSLLDTNPKDIDVYVSRAEMLMFSSQYTAAAADYETALSLVPQGAASADKRRQIEYGMAVSLIRSGDEARAIVLLKPYIENGTADIFMQGDYISALRFNADYKMAIREGERLWPDYGKVPNFGLQALGDAYLRTGQMAKAVQIYDYILKRDPNAKIVKLGLAYSYMADGHLGKGLELYRQILKEDPKLATVALDDAYDFVAKNRYTAGKSLYKLVVEQFPDNVLFRQEMANSLTNNEMPRQAYLQFEFLAKLADGKLSGNAGMAETAVIVGDYHAAGKAIGALREMQSRSAISQAAIVSFEKRRRGGMEIASQYSSDYKGNETKQLLITSDQNIGGSYSILAALGRTRITDKDTNETSSLNNRAVGMQYVGMKYDVRAWLDNYVGEGSFSGYRILTNYYISDHTVMNFDFEKAPVLDAQALNPANAEGFGRIMASNYTVGFRRQIGANTTYSVNVTRGFYNDGNQVNAYDVRRDQTLFSREKKSLDWFIFAGRTNYKFQQINAIDTVYESPIVRQIYGTGLTERWLIPKGYLEGTVVLEWGNDRPEPTDFSPNFRLEYGHNYSPTRLLVLGAEYGLRTNRLENSSKLRFSYRQYDLRYQIAW